MIFNSISKQLNSQPPQKHDYNPSDYHPSTHSRMTNSNYITSSRMSDRESSLSQMNRKIMNNLQYLKYKDTSRDAYLKGSRVSNRSNKSNRSYHSNQSLQRSTHIIKTKPHVVEVASKWRFNDVRTPQNEHYFPRKQAAIKPQFSNWQKPVSNKTSSTKYPQSYPYYQPQASQYRQMLRKPITIQEYTSKYGINQLNHPSGKIPEKDVNINNGQFELKSPLAHQSKEDLLSFQMFRTNSGKELKQTHRDQNKVQGRNWVHSFGQKFKSQTPQPLVEPEKEKLLEKTSKSSLFNLSKNQPEALTPLPKEKSKKSGLIIAGVLVALGLMLFILQISK